MQNADVNERINAWFDDKFMERARRYPQALAGLGIKERMDEWNDPSRAFALEELDRITQDMKELKANFNPQDLDESAQLSYRLFLENSQNTLDGAKWWYHGYDFTQMFGPHSTVPTFLVNQHPFDDSDDLTLMLANFQKKVEKLGLSEEKTESLYEDAITALLTSVKPAYAALVTEMERQKEMTTTDDGAWKLPEGDAYYAHRLKMMTTTDMTAT